MRDRFHEVTTDLLDSNESVAVVLADIGVRKFAEAGAIAKHPDRVINVGIREQLMIAVAAGFALEGFRPIAHSYAPFLIERPFEQIKLDFSHQGVTGILVSVGASHDASGEGRTHQAPADVALMATLPGWSVMVPGHPDEVEALLRWAVNHGETSAYLRLAERSNTQAHDTRPGEFAVVREAAEANLLVVAVGPTLDPVLEATRDMHVSVLYGSTARPFDRNAVARHAGSGDVVLVEPYLEGTSAGEIAASLANQPHRQLAIGVPRTEHRHYGTPSQHDAAHRLDASGIAQRIRAFA